MPLPLRKEHIMKHILCFGDSNTWGFIPGTARRYDEHTRWTGVLADELGSDWRVHEDGLNGRTSMFDSAFKGDVNKNGLDVFPGVLDGQKPLDVLVICLGTNDLKQHPAWHAAQGVGRLVSYAQHIDVLNPWGERVFRNGPKILVISPIAIGEDLVNRDVNDDLKGKHEESRKFPKVFGDLCQSMGIEMLDAQKIAEPSDVDCIHMTKEGHRALGKAVADKVKRIMGE